MCGNGHHETLSKFRASIVLRVRGVLAQIAIHLVKAVPDLNSTMHLDRVFVHPAPRLAAAGVLNHAERAAVGYA